VGYTKSEIEQRYLHVHVLNRDTYISRSQVLGEATITVLMMFYTFICIHISQLSEYPWSETMSETLYAYQFFEPITPDVVAEDSTSKHPKFGAIIGALSIGHTSLWRAYAQARYTLG
jgi:hypothetical protein